MLATSSIWLLIVMIMPEAAQSALEREEAELRWAVDDDDIVIMLDGRDGKRHAGKKEPVDVFLVGQHSGRVVLELHEFEIAWHEVQPGEVCLAYDRAQGLLLVVIADRAVKGLIFRLVEFRLNAEERGHARLGVKVDGKDAVALQHEILRKVGAGRRLAGAALKVGDGEHLEMLVGAPPRGIGRLCARQMRPHIVELLQSVKATARRPFFRLFELASQRHLPEVAVGDSKNAGDLAARKAPKRLLRLRREEPRHQGRQLRR